MNIRWRPVLLTGALILGSPVAIPAAPVADPAAIVNPFLGTSHEGNTFPGADAPFGMVQWSPDTPGNGGAQPPATVIRPTGSITSGLAGKCLDAVGNGTANGTQFVIWTCNGAANQKWSRS
ncbi:RICIN domain-containing protein [Catellatospora sp. KI3]|uniref:RICIN domain-containing protein n=1 Tax=Catellatospora sp. KI3 TaxID=3041620 RepID=UPI0024825ED6|nr:RICIN domain-containing protein [Catellatospora sp. KI3]MDI1461136.1 RICIN domain-containing protein [Catellatospora sp. KI3]